MLFSHGHVSDLGGSPWSGGTSSLLLYHSDQPGWSLSSGDPPELVGPIFGWVLGFFWSLFGGGGGLGRRPGQAVIVIGRPTAATADPNFFVIDQPVAGLVELVQYPPLTTVSFSPCRSLLPPIAWVKRTCYHRMKRVY